MPTYSVITMRPRARVLVIYAKAPGSISGAVPGWKHEKDYLFHNLAGSQDLPAHIDLLKSKQASGGGMIADPRQTPANGIRTPRAGMLLSGMPPGSIPGDIITAGPVVPFPGVPGSGPIVPGLFFLKKGNSGSISMGLVLMAQKGHEYTPLIKG